MSVATVESPQRGSRACVDGNEAAASIAYALSEVIAIYPITPASAMGEHADTWSAGGRTNLWGAVPEVVEMQSEAGAAGTLHGAVQAGALATTFTASQGLLLMLPNMFKIAGELTPTVIHVRRRPSLPTRASIFGDHSDVMAARSTGFAMLASSSVQEAHDRARRSRRDAALACPVPALLRRVPHVARGEHDRPADGPASARRRGAIAQHRLRQLRPTSPVIRPPRTRMSSSRVVRPPTAITTPFPASSASCSRSWAHTGRHYGLVDYHGHPQAERVVVIMGSGTGAVAEAVDELVARGERIGVLTVRLFRPFPVAPFWLPFPRPRAASPCSTARRSQERSVSRCSRTS